MIKLEAKSHNLKLKIEITGDEITRQIFSSSQYALSKRLQAMGLSIRSEITLFLLEVEKEIRLE